MNIGLKLSIFSVLSQYTKKNIKKREINHKYIES